MTAIESRTASRLTRRPVLSAEQALAVVRRRLREADRLEAALFHHPFLGLVFAGGPRRAGQQRVVIHAAVDLVGGRAFVTEPWDRAELVEATQQRDDTAGITDPKPVVATEDAIAAARDAVTVIMFRRRRYERRLELDMVVEPVVFGKPNWWITGTRAGAPVEVVVDAITGKHYAFRA